MTRETYVAGLRAAADFYEQHPELAFPHVNQLDNYSMDKKEEAILILKAIGACTKTYSDNYITFNKEIIPDFFLKFTLNRSEVCEKVQVGTKKVAAQTLPAREETFIPEREEPIYEYHCPSILKG